MPQLTLQNDHVKVHICLDPTSSSIPNVFALAARMQQWIRRLFPLLCRAWLQARLADDLGPRYGRDQRFDAGSSQCPECGSRQAKRKSWRSRQVAVPRWGKTSIERPYVRCRRCGRSWAPYDQALGLKGKRTYHRQGLERPVEQAIQTSYRRAARAHPEAPSPSTLHRRMQKSPPLPLQDESTGSSGPSPPATAAVGTGLADGTRIPAQRSDTQHSLVLAHGVRRSSPSRTAGTPGLQRTVLAAYAGPEAGLPERLRQNAVRPAALVGDGHVDWSDAAPNVGRGRWHVPHTVGQLLYSDGISGEQRHVLKRQVATLVFEEASAQARRQAIARWVWAMRHVAPTAARHLVNAADGLAELDRTPDQFVVETTSPIEREMHEAGRRFENGGQWSQSGATAMARWWQLWRHHPDAFDRVFNDPAS